MSLISCVHRILEVLVVQCIFCVIESVSSFVEEVISLIDIVSIILCFIDLVLCVIDSIVEVIDSVLMSPLIVPQVIVGLSFLIFFVRMDGWPQFGRLLVLHSLLTLPYATRVVRASLARVDPKLEEAAIGLGATPVESFLRVTLPQIRSGLFVAVFFCFVVSFDKFTATAFLASNGATLPVEIFYYIESRLDPTISAVAALMMLGTTVFVLVADRLVGIHRVT